jgi:hypothetical protein
MCLSFVVDAIIQGGGFSSCRLDVHTHIFINHTHIHTHANTHTHTHTHTHTVPAFNYFLWFLNLKLMRDPYRICGVREGEEEEHVVPQHLAGVRMLDPALEKAWVAKIG